MSATVRKLVLLAAMYCAQTAFGAAPPNDNFANRTVIPAVLPQSVTGSNVGATVELNETTPTFTPGGASVWWTWTPSSSQRVTITTAGSTFDTLLGVYTGTAVDSLTSVAEDNDSNLTPQSRVTFNAVSGTAYQIVVCGVDNGSGNGPATGSIALSLGVVTPAPANDAFASAVTLTTNVPTNGSNFGCAANETGEPAHDGNSGGASVWYKWTAPATPPTQSVTISLSNLTFNNLLAVYTGTTVGALTTVTSSRFGRPLTFIAQAGVTYSIAVDGYDEGTDNGYPGASGPDMGNFTIKAQTGFADLIVLSMSHSPIPAAPGTPVTFTVTVKNNGISDVGQFSVGFYVDASTAPTSNSSPDQTQGISGLASGASTSLTFTINAPVVGAYEAWAYADQFDEVAEVNKANNAGPLPSGHSWTITPPPPVITSSASIAGTVGVAFAFAVSATNSATAFSATGLPGGLAIDAATGIISGTPAASGTFAVGLKATNAGGAGTATLNITINPAPPIISSPLSATGVEQQPFSYQITAFGSAPFNFSTSTLPAGMVLSGDTITGTPTQAGTYLVTLTVSNSSSFDTKTLIVKVNPFYDSNGNGIPDAMFTVLGLDPKNPPTPPLASGPTLVLGITRLDFNLNSTAKNMDQMIFSGFFDFNDAPLSQSFTIYIGGVARTFMLSKGRAPRGTPDSLSMNSRNGKVQFSGKFTKGDFLTSLQAFGVSTTSKTSLATVPVYVLFNNTLSYKQQFVQFAVKSGKISSKAVGTDTISGR